MAGAEDPAVIPLLDPLSKIAVVEDGQGGALITLTEKCEADVLAGWCRFERAAGSLVGGVG